MARGYSRDPDRSGQSKLLWWVRQTLAARLDVSGLDRASGQLKDVIRCGPGRDLVMFFGRREQHDRYRNCERVVPYSP